MYSLTPLCFRWTVPLSCENIRLAARELCGEGRQATFRKGRGTCKRLLRHNRGGFGSSAEGGGRAVSGGGGDQRGCKGRHNKKNPCKCIRSAYGFSKHSAPCINSLGSRELRLSPIQVSGRVEDLHFQPSIHFYTRNTGYICSGN
jgi:hypothetical protein